MLEATVQKGCLTSDKLAGRLDDLRALPGTLNIALGIQSAFETLSFKLAKVRDILLLGCGLMKPTAIESALKVKKVLYINAEADAWKELKHEPIPLLNQHVRAIAMVSREALFDQTVSNKQDMVARGCKVLLVLDKKGITEAGEGTWETLVMPKVRAPILNRIPA